MAAAVQPTSPEGEPAEMTQAVQKNSDEAKGKKAKTDAAPFSKLFMLASWPEMMLCSVGICAAIIGGGSNPALVYMWGKLLDAAGGEEVSMSTQVGFICLVGALSWLMAMLQSGCLRTFAMIQSMKMRKQYYAAILNKDISWFDQRTPAALPQELNADAERLAEALADKLGQGIMGAAGFVISIILGFTMGWKLALVVLGSVPLMMVGMIFFGKAVQEVASESQSWYSQAAAVVEETLYAVRTVVSLGGERREIAKYSTAVRKAQQAARRNDFKIALGMGWTEAVFNWCIAGALYVGMIFLYDGEVNGSTGKVWTGGDVIMVFFLVLTAGFLLGQVEPMVKVVSEGRVAMARFIKVYTAKSEIEAVGEDTRKKLTTFHSFEFQSVHFTYPNRPDIPVLQGVSFRIEKGTKVAFVGESGSGKSTVMSLLERFYDPVQGAVLINGEDARTFAPASLRAIIGYVGQEPVLFTTSVRNNILQGWPQATEEELQHALKVAQVAFINNLPDGLDTFVGSGGSQFSGGQKQRIAIARAVLRKPKVLFLDEATSALDAESEATIQETLDSIGKMGVDGEPLTTVAIAHRLGTIRNSDVIHVLKAGVIVEQGSHAQLMQQAGGIYQALAATQAMRATEDTKEEGNGSKQKQDELLSPKTAAVRAAAHLIESDEGTKKATTAWLVRLLRFNKPEWPLYAPGILFSLVHGSTTPIMGYLIVSVLDALYGPKDTMKEEVFDTTMYFIILGGVTLLSSAIQCSCFGILGEALTARLRIALLTNVFRQEVGYHDDPDHTPALLSSALQVWAYRVKTLNAAIGALHDSLGAIISGLAIAFFGCWRLALLMLAALPVMAVAGTIQFNAMLGGTSLSNDNMKVAQQVVSDSVQNARTVHAIGCKASLVKTFDERVHTANAGFERKSFTAGCAYGFGLAMPCFIMAAAFGYTDYLIKEGLSDFKGTMWAFMGLLYSGMATGQAMGKLGDLKKAKEAQRGIFKLLDRESAIDGLDPKGRIPEWAASSPAQAGRIEFQAVGFTYPFRPDSVVLSDVSFKVAAGSSVGLVGPSGGGKSTMLALIQRFYDPSKGSVLIGDAQTKLSSIDIRWWRKQIGFVGQEPILFNTTVKENVMYGIDTEHGEEVSAKQYDDCIRMARVDFSDTLNVGPRGSQLSGGQKQRVAICRALIRNPPILLFDEATSALDSESEKLVQQALEAVRVGRTSITIAHRLSTVQDCDMIIVAADGTIVEQGTHATLIEKGGVYFKLWRGKDATAPATGSR